MENSEKIEIIERFLNTVIIEELQKLQKADIKYMHFVMMGQAIEVLGGFLDNKPMKARDQSAKRFNKSINALFGGHYRLLNDKMFLYDKLRNQMTHTFIPSKDIILLNDRNTSYQHLEKIDGKVVLIAKDFYNDIYKACERLIYLLKTGKVKPKNIAFGNEE